MAERNLSKSKLIAWRQCPRRLWLELHRPDLREESADVEARFATGEQVGAVARRLYDPNGDGIVLDPGDEGIGAALERTRRLLDSPQPIFEAGLSGGGVLAFADVMLPERRRSRAWRMIEVKSSTSVKGYQRDDAAIQAHAAREAGVPLSGVSVACIDNSWVYGGGGDYRGLLHETDLTAEVLERETEVRTWVAEAQQVASQGGEPAVATGAHCEDPFPCPFSAHCGAAEPQPEYPSSWLPNVMKAELRQHIEHGATDMRDVPDELLNERQLRVKRHTLSGRPSVRRAPAAAMLAGYDPPAYFLDFEAVQFAVPIWPGTRPYQQIPFQFSVHRLSRSGSLEHRSFLDLSGEDPSEALAEALVAAVDGPGPVFVYSAGFERMCVNGLSERFPRLAPALQAIGCRIVDLLPIVRESYYHPSQRGSWSLKAVVPAMAPDLDYDSLEGVSDGGMAAAAYLEAIDPGTDAGRRCELESELTTYCERDTLALVRIRDFLLGPATSCPGATVDRP